MMPEGFAGDQLNRLLTPLVVVARLAEQQGPDEARTWRHRSFESLILHHARAFHRSARGALDPADQRGQPGRCLADASELSAQAGHAYAQGVALPAGLPIGVRHAWCITADGEVLDPAWPTGEAAVYIGVPFTAAFRRRMRPPALLGHHRHGLALLRDGVPPGALVDIGEPLPPSAQAPAWTATHLPY
ncbi:hypothetical protein ACQP00_20515 [Dactylosporangium sp. CS-047395]|uniref:hypothetical protein n=1 Tax=Dactylosporangium sp. CS-047395 TaxID=3239936 RepID=UPI003D94DD72